MIDLKLFKMINIIYIIYNINKLYNYIINFIYNKAVNYK